MNNSGLTSTTDHWVETHTLPCPKLFGESAVDANLVFSFWSFEAQDSNAQVMLAAVFLRGNDLR